jgi:hypothetical protein
LEDLADFRRAALDAILRLNWQPIDCGYWSAGGNPPLKTCLGKVEEADVVLAIVAHRHGWTPPDQPEKGHKSITRLECERAHQNGIEVIPFFVDDKAHWDATLTEAHRIHEANPEEIATVATEVGRSVQSLREFKGWLDSVGTRRVFSNAEQLGIEVLHALTEWGIRHGLTRTSASAASVRASYLDWLRRTCESVELLGLDLKETQNVRLGQVYVPAVTLAKPSETERSVREGMFGEQRYDLLLHRLGVESLYVPGAPGAGKSTFCRWLALAVATGSVPAHSLETPEEFEEELPESLLRRFPLLCRLREWAGQSDCLAGNGHWTRAQFDDALACWCAATKPGGLTPEVWREEMAQGRCLLILDGVDEVPETLGPHRPRHNLLTGLADALPEWLKAGNRVLLTSRPYGLEDADRHTLGLPLAELAQLPGPLQQTFIRRWYAAADAPRAEEKASGLIAHLDERRDLEELRANPMLLTALCVKYDEGQRLPKDFYRLYDSVVNQVLHKRYLAENERDRARLRLAAVALGMHRGSRERPRTTPEAEASIDEVDRILAELAQSDYTTESGGVDAAERREELLSNSGLLLPRPGSRAGFYHLSFQEFFAAVRLRRLGERPHDLLARHAATPAWRRTLTFLFCAIADQESPESAVAGYAPLLDQLDPQRLVTDPNPALLLADCLEVAHGRGWNLERFAAPLRLACEHALEHLKPPERAHLWRTLGQLGLDDRPGVGIRDGLPDIDWVDVPEGKFKYGDDAKEMPLHAFRIARYPITNAQFQCFIDDKGYESDDWWEGLDRPAPERPRWAYANHPRETASWYEAVAFCRWLDVKLRARGDVAQEWKVRLPTEQEWEKAARGIDGREFPWGKFESGRANLDESLGEEGPFRLGQTSAVGIYPQGVSPHGALDMAGNVWEWCADEYDQTDRSEERPRVLRGGSWYRYRLDCRAAYRAHAHPGLRNAILGFRLCFAPPIN